MLELLIDDHGNRQVLRFEHSLFSISKWESKHKKAWLSKNPKTHDESIDYYQCMLLDGSDPNEVYRLRPDQTESLEEYMVDPMSATIIPDQGPQKPSREVNTSDLIYSQMVMLQVPFEAQYWHINRLLVLIAITAIKQKPEKSKGVTREKMTEWHDLNEQRKQQLGTSG